MRVLVVDDERGLVRALHRGLTAEGFAVDIAANGVDVARAREGGTSEAMIDRLALTPGRLAGMADGLRDIAALPDPVGEVIRGWTNANGVAVRMAVLETLLG